MEKKSKIRDHEFRDMEYRQVILITTEEARGGGSRDFPVCCIGELQRFDSAKSAVALQGVGIFQKGYVEECVEVVKVTESLEVGERAAKVFLFVFSEYDPKSGRKQPYTVAVYANKCTEAVLLLFRQFEGRIRKYCLICEGEVSPEEEEKTVGHMWYL